MEDDAEPTDPDQQGANELQAEQLREELARQIALLEREIANYKAALISYSRNLMPTQAKRVEREMRRRITELRQLNGLLATLDERFPRNPP